MIYTKKEFVLRKGKGISIVKRRKGEDVQVHF